MFWPSEGQITASRYGYVQTTQYVPKSCTLKSNAISDLQQFVQSAKLAGHEDWIRALAFHQVTEDQPLLLASGSQDGTIRLWNIDPIVSAKQTLDTAEDDLLEAFEASLGEVGEGEEGGKQISLKRHVLTTKSSAGGYVCLVLRSCCCEIELTIIQYTTVLRTFRCTARRA